MDPSSAVQILAIVILLLLSSFFSSAETALISVNKIKIKTLVDEGDKRAIKLTYILDNYSKMISTILIGNNIVNIAASSLTTTFVISEFGSVYVGIGTGVLTLLVLMFGEIIPKTLAKTYAETIALNYTFIIHKLMFLLTPVIYFINILSRAIMKLLHIDPDKKLETMTESELKTYVDVSHEDGVIESEEREIIYNVFDFSDAVAKDIMIPRINMVTIDKEGSYDELYEIFKEFMYTRIPVYSEEPDNVVGVVNIKDFLFIHDKEHFTISSLLRKAHYTYEFKKTADLMLEMRENAQNVTFVLNEYGSCVGMVTLEDLLEEIVGEIRDEYDDDEREQIQQLDAYSYMVDGYMKMDDINDILSTEMDSADYDSVAGLIIEHLDRLPEVGECVTLEDGISLQVTEVDQNRITKVMITLPSDTPASKQEAPLA
ncbi:MAG: hemolysin family protein [Lachnospiraceae bacterium]